MKHTVVLVRHGESTWNKENLFTGWVDVPLSEKGVGEATAGGKLLKEDGFTFDVAYTSTLKRAIKTLWLVLEELDLMYIPIVSYNYWDSISVFNSRSRKKPYNLTYILSYNFSFTLVLFPLLTLSIVKNEIPCC